MHIHLFGSATPTGEAFRHQCLVSPLDFTLTTYSRRNSSTAFADFCDPSGFFPEDRSIPRSFWVSFGPIWLFAPFLESLVNNYPDRLLGLDGVVACSSSSVITKRFATNRFDRELVDKLLFAEDKLLDLCMRLDIPCRILRPTLVYGRAGSYVDRNLSVLINTMRKTPFLPLPRHTGLRQPIHAFQLASVALQFVSDNFLSRSDSCTYERVALGGDIELSYLSMLTALQDSLPLDDPARRCRFLLFPPRLFYFFASPLLLRSPKLFEAFLRLGVNLSGFIRVSEILEIKPQSFPFHPFF